MKRRTLLNSFVLGSTVAGFGLWGTRQTLKAEPPAEETADEAINSKEITMTLEDWKRVLPQERYDILFREKTERAFTSPLNEEYRTGTFICAACYLPLFSSADKFDSGTGWPSFTRPINDDAIDTKKDFKLIWPRTEYHCSRCDGHQGHVFDDGPEPTGQRWCNNGLALEFVPEGEALPELRG